MQLLLDHERLGVRVAATTAADGDVHPIRVPSALLEQRQVALTGRRWAMAAQVHGTDVWTADSIRPADRLAAADIVVLERRSATAGPTGLAMWAADCATVVFVAPDAIVGVHAGWRGLAAGVIQRAASLVDAEATVVGPMIGPCCYEFSTTDLEAVATGVGADTAAIAAIDTAGAPALDVAASVRSALDQVGLVADATAVGCTGCADGGRRWFSHRARVDVGRHALVGWFA